MQVLARKQDYDRANVLLGEIVDVLEGMARERERWDTAHGEIEPRYLQALKDQPERASALRAVMAFATEKAEAGEFEKALDALKRMEGILGGPSQSTADKAAPGPEETDGGISIKKLG